MTRASLSDQNARVVDALHADKSQHVVERSLYDSILARNFGAANRLFGSILTVDESSPIPPMEEVGVTQGLSSEVTPGTRPFAYAGR